MILVSGIGQSNGSLFRKNRVYRLFEISPKKFTFVSRTTLVKWVGSNYTL